jgi:hypothetical protein
MAGVYSAAEKKEWEKVKVRCPLEAFSVRAVRLVSGPLKPSSHAGLGLAVPNPALTSGASPAILS